MRKCLGSECFDKKNTPGRAEKINRLAKNVGQSDKTNQQKQLGKGKNVMSYSYTARICKDIQIIKFYEVRRDTGNLRSIIRSVRHHYVVHF